MWENHFLAAIKDAIKKPLTTYAKTDAAAAAVWTVTSPSLRHRPRSFDNVCDLEASVRRRGRTGLLREEGTSACVALREREGRHT